MKTKKTKDHLNQLIKSKKIISKIKKEIDFLKSFKFLKKIGRIDIVISKNKFDHIGINKISDLL